MPVISDLLDSEHNSYRAEHACSGCERPLFACELSPGMQLIATKDIKNLSGDYLIPRGRVLRLSAFGEMPCTGSPGLLFAGLLGAGAFSPRGFATHWDIHKILNVAD